MVIRKEIEEALKVKDSEKLDVLVDLFEELLTKKLEKFTSSLEDISNGSVQEGIEEVRYSLLTNALYPTDVTLVFDKDDYKMISKELGVEPDDKVATVQTDWGPVHLTQRP